MEPLTARCRSCDARVELRAIATARDGSCPGCATPFSSNWTVLLVEECEAAEHLTHALIRSLRRLCGLPGNLELQPDEILLNLTGEVPWRQSIDTDPGRVADEIKALTERLDRTDAPVSSLTSEFRAVATELIHLSMILDANQEATEPTQLGAGLATRDAAHAIDSAANAIEGGESDTSALRSGLNVAASALTPSA